jgi:hypothetical protein
MFMLYFPAANLFCMLPLIAVRLSAMARGKEYGETIYMVVGSIVASTGTVDTVLYVLTRSTLERDNARFGSSHDPHGSQASKQSINMTSMDLEAYICLDNPKQPRPSLTRGKSLDEKSVINTEHELHHPEDIVSRDASKPQHDEKIHQPNQSLRTDSKARDTPEPPAQSAAKKSSFWKNFSLMEEDGGPAFSAMAAMKSSKRLAIKKDVSINFSSEPASEGNSCQPDYYNRNTKSRPLSAVGRSLASVDSDADDSSLDISLNSPVTASCEASRSLSQRSSRADRPIHSRAYRYYS